MERSFTIPAISQSAYLWLAGLLLLFLVVTAILGWQSFFEPSFWFAVILLLLTVGVFAWFLVGQQHSLLAISDQGLRLKVPMYGRVIPTQAVVFAQIQPVTLDRQSPYRLKWRTNGLSVPGYDLGWFSTFGGGKVLAAITKTDQVIAIPTTKGYTLLVSVEQPDQVTAQLQQFVPE